MNVMGQPGAFDIDNEQDLIKKAIPECITEAWERDWSKSDNFVKESREALRDLLKDR